MREIKFRAWDGRHIIHDGDCWNGENHQLGNTSTSYPVTVLHYGIKWCRKYPRPMPEDVIELDRVEARDIVIMQYTGLRDKKGVEIYEGDVLFISSGIGKTHGLVEWIDNGWWIRGEHSQGWPGEEYRTVVGNIYENPELLK